MLYLLAYFSLRSLARSGFGSKQMTFSAFVIKTSVFSPLLAPMSKISFILNSIKCVFKYLY